MKFDWSALATVAWSVILLIAGALLGRLLERKAKLTYYASHWSAYPRPGPPPITIHTHGIVIKNVGNKTATDVRIQHELRPEMFYVTPSMGYTDPDMPGGGFEIVLPQLMPQKEVAISYMHTQPFHNFRGQITHSDGLAVEVPAISRAEYPRWMFWTVLILALIGLIAVAFLAVVLSHRALTWWG